MPPPHASFCSPPPPRIPPKAGLAELLDEFCPPTPRREARETAAGEQEAEAAEEAKETEPLDGDMAAKATE